MSCWKRKLGGDPQLAGLAQSFAADPVLHRKRQVSNSCIGRSWLPVLVSQNSI